LLTTAALLLAMFVGRKAVPAFVPLMFGAIGLGLLVTGIRERRLANEQDRAAAGERTSFSGVALSGGRSSTAHVEQNALVLETHQLRRWFMFIVGLGFALHVAYQLSTFGAPSRVPWWIFFLVAVPGLNRRVETRYPLDAFAAVETRERTVLLHRRGGAKRPLEIALKSWQVARFEDAVRARDTTGLLDATPPASPAAPRDEMEEAATEIAAWLPEGRSPLMTFGGAALLAAGLLLGAYRLVEDLPHGNALTWGVAAAGIFVWLQESSQRAMEAYERRRLKDGAPEPLGGETRRDRGDAFGWLLPWCPAQIDAGGGRLRIVRRPAEMMDLVVMIAVACLASWLVIGSFTPWWAAACFFPLLLSGYPRRREDTEEIVAEHVLASNDTGGRVTLTVEDEDGEREVQLRFASGKSARFTALLRQLCPGADTREPGWRR
jgi:hypothetical protein